MESWSKQVNDAYANIFFGGIFVLVIVICLIVAMSTKKISVPVGMMFIAGIIYLLLFALNYERQASSFSFLWLFICCVIVLTICSYIIFRSQYGIPQAIVVGVVVASLSSLGYWPLHAVSEDFEQHTLYLIIHNETDDDITYVFPKLNEENVPELPSIKPSTPNIVYRGGKWSLPYDWYGRKNYFEQKSVDAIYLYILNQTIKDTKNWNEIIRDNDYLELLKITEDDFVDNSFTIHIK